jgi:hypothetical protein
MTTFFLDLWQDLREKRLWPVAVGLLAAAVAIPAIMLKPAAAPSTPAPIAANDNKAETLPAVSVDSSPTHGSKLQTFDERNPFKPLKDLQDDPASGPSAGGSSSGKSAPGSGGSTPSGGGSGAGGGSGSPAGGTPSGSPGGGGGDVPPVTSPTPRPDGNGGIRWFKFVADVDFGKSGADPKHMKNVNPLTLLPSENAPVVIFMGVTADAKGAKFFLVDPSFTADGEGDCNDAQNCQFITLQLDEGHNEETFTSRDGSVAYDLKLVKLRRQEVSAAAARGDAVDTPKKNGKSSVSAAGAHAISDVGHQFLPWLISGPETTVDDLK